MFAEALAILYYIKSRFPRHSKLAQASFHVVLGFLVVVRLESFMSFLSALLSAFLDKLTNCDFH